MDSPTELVERYVAMWNEPDSEARRAMVRERWAPEGAQILQPPLEMLEQARRVGFINPVLAARGHHELEVRVGQAYEEFVAPGEFRFRRRGHATQLGEVVKFGWEMVPVGGGDPAGVGVEFLILDPHGRIRTDYQFIEQ
jgi:hypothetical protein